MPVDRTQAKTEDQLASRRDGVAVANRPRDCCFALSDLTLFLPRGRDSIVATLSARNETWRDRSARIAMCRCTMLRPRASVGVPGGLYASLSRSKFRPCARCDRLW